MPDDVLTLPQALQFLRNAAPIQFDHFKAAFAKYSTDVTNNLIFADGNVVLAQGRAQQCKDIMNELERIK